jgi:competence CoiA-like predicted nuclease
MLTCLVGEKNIDTFTYKEQQLRSWSKKGILKCPICEEKMLYCHGDYKIPYFRHEKNSDCPDIYSEGVTQEHVRGIKILYEWLSNLEGIENLQLEKWIPQTKQRPDIYFVKDGQEYVIEFQCSPISTKFNERRDLYRLQGIKDIWILGMDKYLFESINRIEKYINKNNTFEKRMKTIEIEILNSNENLLYLDSINNRIYTTNYLKTKPAKRTKESYYSDYSYDVELKVIYDVSLISNPFLSLPFDYIFDKNIVEYDKDKKYYTYIINSEKDVIKNFIQNNVNFDVLEIKELSDKCEILYRDITNKNYKIYYDYNNCCFEKFQIIDRHNKKITSKLEVIDKNRVCINYKVINIKDLKICGNEIITDDIFLERIKEIKNDYYAEKFNNNYKKCIEEIVNSLNNIIREAIPNSYVSINPRRLLFTKDQIEVTVQFGYVGYSIFYRTYKTNDINNINFKVFINNFYKDILFTTKEEYNNIRKLLLKTSKHYSENVIKINKSDAYGYEYNIDEPLMTSNDGFIYSYGMNYSMKSLYISNNSIKAENKIIKYKNINELEIIIKRIISNYIRELRYGIKGAK